MIYSDLDSLQRDKSQGGLYDMFITTFINNIKVEVFGYVIKKEEEMRPDLVCTSIYKKIDHVSFLCNLNNVKNPLSVKMGDIWLYVNENQIPTFTPSTATTDAVRQQLINKNKGAKVDPKRASEPTKPDTLPPTIKKETSPNVVVDDQLEVIILGSASASQRPKPNPAGQ